MVKTQSMKKRKKEDELLKRIVIIGFIVIIVIKLIEGVSLSLNVESVNSNRYTNSHVNISLFKMAINSTISGFEYSSKDNDLSLLNVMTEVFYDFNARNRSTIIASTIPFFGYIDREYALQNGYANEVIPALSSQSSVSSKNNPQYYNGIHQDEIISIQNESDVHHTGEAYTYNQLNDLDFLTKYVYAVDPSIDVTMRDFDIDYFMNQNMKVNLNTSDPKILIFHTHSQEEFRDSRPGVEDDTIVGVGEELTKILKYRYGVNVIHDKTQYDMKNGMNDSNYSYDRVDKAIPLILEQYPTIEVVIDMHRDGVNDNIRLVTNNDGKQTAKIMFFNGLCRPKVAGVMTGLTNPYVKDNMAFSLQMQMKANELYPDLNPSLTRKIYLKPYRYSTHFKPQSLLVEVGAQTNTIQEAKNAMEPLAEILYSVLTE